MRVLSIIVSLNLVSILQARRLKAEIENAPVVRTDSNSIANFKTINEASEIVFPGDPECGLKHDIDKRMFASLVDFYTKIIFEEYFKAFKTRNDEVPHSLYFGRHYVNRILLDVFTENMEKRQALYSSDTFSDTDKAIAESEYHFFDAGFGLREESSHHRPIFHTDAISMNHRGRVQPEGNKQEADKPLSIMDLPLGLGNKLTNASYMFTTVFGYGSKYSPGVQILAELLLENEGSSQYSIFFTNLLEGFRSVKVWVPDSQNLNVKRLKNDTKKDSDAKDESKNDDSNSSNESLNSVAPKKCAKQLVLATRKNATPFEQDDFHTGGFARMNGVALKYQVLKNSFKKNKDVDNKEVEYYITDTNGLVFFPDEVAHCGITLQKEKRKNRFFKKFRSQRDVVKIPKRGFKAVIGHLWDAVAEQELYETAARALGIIGDENDKENDKENNESDLNGKESNFESDAVSESSIDIHTIVLRKDSMRAAFEDLFKEGSHTSSSEFLDREFKTRFGSKYLFFHPQDDTKQKAKVYGETVTVREQLSKVTGTDVWSLAIFLGADKVGGSGDLALEAALRFDELKRNNNIPNYFEEERKKGIKISEEAGPIERKRAEKQARRKASKTSSLSCFKSDKSSAKNGTSGEDAGHLERGEVAGENSVVTNLSEVEIRLAKEKLAADITPRV